MGTGQALQGCRPWRVQHTGTRRSRRRSPFPSTATHKAKAPQPAPLRRTCARSRRSRQFRWPLPPFPHAPPATGLAGLPSPYAPVRTCHGHARLPLPRIQHSVRASGAPQDGRLPMHPEPFQMEGALLHATPEHIGSIHVHYWTLLPDSNQQCPICARIFSIFRSDNIFMN